MAQMASLKVLSFHAVTIPELTSGLSIFHAACVKGDDEKIANIIISSPSKLDTIVGLHVSTSVNSGEKLRGKTSKEILALFGTQGHLKALALLREMTARLEKRPLLHLAARAGTTWHCDRLIIDGADVNEVSTFEEDSYSTPLNLAIAHNTEAVVNFLIRKGADVLKADRSELNAVHYAAMKGTPDLLSRLMGNNQELKTHAWNGFSLLHLAACCGNLATMSMLVRLGTHVDKSSYGRSRHDLFPPGLPSKYMDGTKITPLMCAATQGHLAAVDFLIQHGADVNMVNIEYECTALFFAAECGHTDVVRLLLSHMTPDGILIKDNCGRTALHEAKLPNIVELLIQNGLSVNDGDIDGCTPLHYSARVKNFAVTEKLLQHGADINAEDGVGKTPLFHVLDSEENLDVINFFVTNGCSTTHKNNYGDTPLHRAIHLGHDTTKYLLDHGAINCINTLGAYKQSPLHIAAKMDYPITELLLKSGADANLTDRMGPSPIASAVSSGRADNLRLLAEHGGDVNLLCCKRYNGKGDSTLVPLHIAVQEANYEVVKLLLELGAVVNARDFHDKTPLHYATSLKVNAYQISHCLVQHGADLNVTDSNTESTPLHLVAGREDGTDMLKMFLECGGEINKTDKSGDIPLHLAVSRGCLQNVQLLVEHGSDVNKQNFKWSTSVSLANTALKNRQQIKELLNGFKSCKI